MDHELLKDVSKIQGQSVRRRQTPVSGRQKKINSPIHRNDGTSVTANLSRGNSWLWKRKEPFSQIWIYVCFPDDTVGPCEREGMLWLLFVCDCLEHQWHWQDSIRPSLVHDWEGQTGHLLGVPWATGLWWPCLRWPQVLQWGGLLWVDGRGVDTTFTLAGDKGWAGGDATVRAIICSVKFWTTSSTFPSTVLVRASSSSSPSLTSLETSPASLEPSVAVPFCCWRRDWFAILANDLIAVSIPFLHMGQTSTTVKQHRWNECQHPSKIFQGVSTEMEQLELSHLLPWCGYGWNWYPSGR